MTHRERSERRAAIAQAVAAGRSIRDICGEYHVSLQTLREACREHGTVAGDTATTLRRDLMVLAAWLRGDTAVRAAREAGVTRAHGRYVIDVARDAGIERVNNAGPNRTL